MDGNFIFFTDLIKFIFTGFIPFSMKKSLIGTAAAILLSAKYIQMAQYTTSYNTTLIVLLLTLISSILLSYISFKFLENKWIYSVFTITIIGAISIIAWYFYPNFWLDFTWSLLIFTSLFLAFYRFSHYEIKKFSSFSYSFMIIYILTESISMWRNDVYPPFFFGFLTFIVPMYFVGIIKIKE